MNTRTLLILGIILMLIAVIYTRDLAAAALVASLMANFFTLEQHVDRVTKQPDPPARPIVGSAAPFRQGWQDQGWGRANWSEEYIERFGGRAECNSRQSFDDAHADIASARSRVDCIIERGANIMPEGYKKYYAPEMAESESKQWWGDYDN